MQKRSPSVSERPKILFFGDTHGSFKFVICSVQRYAPEAIVLLGDVQARRPLDVELQSILGATEIWFIHGNHDTDTEADFDNLFGSKLADRNLHGRVVDVCGLRVAGVGGVFREKVWAPPLEPHYRSAAEHLKSIPRQDRWRGGTPLRHRSSIYPDEVNALARSAADVLVTHEGLAGHQCGWQLFNDLASAMDVEVVVHGHLHRTIDYRAECLLDAKYGYQAFGVDMEHCLAWPPLQDQADEEAL